MYLNVCMCVRACVCLCVYMQQHGCKYRTGNYTGVSIELVPSEQLIYSFLLCREGLAATEDLKEYTMMS